jgi:ethanolamine utilization protein EutN
MRIAKVVGTVTMNNQHPTMQGARLRLIVPLSLAELRDGVTPQADEIVAWDDLGAGLGSLVAISEGAEAAQPFRPNYKPIDVYISAILDHVEIDQKLLR